MIEEVNGFFTDDVGLFSLNVWREIIVEYTGDWKILVSSFYIPRISTGKYYFSVLKIFFG